MAEHTLKHAWQHSFINQVINTWKSILADKGVFTMLVVAPILYGFFYPWPYKNEVVHNVPVAIIDYDHSILSDKIITYARVNPRLNAQVISDENQAKQRMWHGDIVGYLVIPAGLYQKVNTGQMAKVSVLANGNYFLLNKQVQTGFLEVIGTVSAGIKIQKSVAQGQDINLSKANFNAVNLTINPLYNPTEGYGSYVVPPVSLLILQQMYFIGTAMLIGTWVEQRKAFANLKTWLARILAISCLGFILGCFFYGIIFPLNDYPRNQNLAGSLILLTVFFPAVAAMGSLIGLWFAARERAMQLLVVSSIPILFLSGVSWPKQMLPEPLLYIRWLLPSTSGMNASLMLNQMGTPLADTKVYLSALIVIFLVCLLGLLWFANNDYHHNE